MTEYMKRSLIIFSLTGRSICKAPYGYKKLRSVLNYLFYFNKKAEKANTGCQLRMLRRGFTKWH